jgi:protein-S-isoprenylcysteine O-methyltransferase Ste14
VPAVVPLALLLLSALLAIAGLVWLFGPFGLLGTSVALALLALFWLEVEEPRAEPVEPPAWPN